MILVTGGTGLLGSHLLPKLILSEEKVRVLVREGTDYRKIFPVWEYYYPEALNKIDKIEWFRGDIINKAIVDEAVEGVDRVYHCAAFISFDKLDKTKMFKTNVIGTRNIVDICLQHKINKLTYLSSIASIGPGSEEEFLTEENKWSVHPKSIYALTKTLAEQEVWRGINEGLNAVILNPSIILGAASIGQSSAAFFETIHKGMKFYTNGINGFVDVIDVVKAMIFLMGGDISGERFIISGINLSYKDLFNKIAKKSGISPPKWYATPLMTSIAWKVAYIVSILTGKPAMITKENAHSAHKVVRYSSEKFLKLSGLSFTNIDETINNIVGFYVNKELLKS